MMNSPVPNKMSRPCLRLKREADFGFSLLEVMVALALFGIAVTVLAQSCWNAVAGLEAVRSQEKGDQDFRFIMRQITLTEQREDMESGGDIETINSGTVSWSATVEETEIIDLFRINLEIDFPGDSRVAFSRDNEARTETFFLLRPAWSVAEERNALLEDKKSKLESERNSIR